MQGRERVLRVIVRGDLPDYDAEWLRFWRAVAEAATEAVRGVSGDHPRGDLIWRACRGARRAAGLPPAWPQ